MKIYIDDDFKCHAQNDGTMREVETNAFDGKCAEYIEGYRFIPEGETWTRSDGVRFTGEMITPWKDYAILETAQTAADRVQAQADEEIATLLDTIEDLILGG